MAIIAKKGTTYKSMEPGAHYLVCADVVDLGMVKTEWQGQVRNKHKIRLVWFADEPRDDGKLFMVSKTFTLSLADTSALKPFLEAWRGKQFTDEELEGFDLENLIGVHALAQTVNVVKGDKTYTNIQTIMRVPRGTPADALPAIPEDYVRVQDRPAQPPVGQATPTGPGDPPPPDEPPYDEPPYGDDLPF